MHFTLLILTEIMKKQLLSTPLFAWTALIAVFFLWGCPSPATPPLSEQIAKNWSANIVKEGATVVYTKGATMNIKAGYSSFKLNLSSPSSVTLSEFDGNTFTGQWSLTADGKTLTLTGLNPQPTGTGGTISFAISEATSTSLKLTRTSASAKTGGTFNDYQLTNP
jgi:hypothetical protein